MKKSVFGSLILTAGVLLLFACYTGEAKGKKAKLDKLVELPKEGTIPFEMGAASGAADENIREISLSKYAIAPTEVTQKQWAAVMGFDDRYDRVTGPLGDDYPMYNVSWYAAIVYCNKLSEICNLTPCYTMEIKDEDGNWYDETNTAKWGKLPREEGQTEGSGFGNPNDWDEIRCNFNANGYRLPTEAEWEYAARAGHDGNLMYSGAEKEPTDSEMTDEPDAASEYAWFYDPSKPSLYKVATTKKSNDFGLYDMSGNVAEWCWDGKAIPITDTKKNPTDIEKVGGYDESATYDPIGSDLWLHKIYRGGSTKTVFEGKAKEKMTLQLRPSARGEALPSYRAEFLGFRVCRSLN